MSEIIIRTKISSNINSFYIPQLVLPEFSLIEEKTKFIIKNGLKLYVTSEHLAELWQIVVESLNLNLPKTWNLSDSAINHSERLKLQSEIDAVCFHQMKLNFDEVNHILSTFKSLDKRVPEEYRYQNIVRTAFNELQNIGISKFIVNGSQDVIRLINDFTKTEYYRIIESKSNGTYKTPSSINIVNEPFSSISNNKSTQESKSKKSGQLKMF